MDAFHSHGRLATPGQLLGMVVIIIAAVLAVSAYYDRQKRQGAREAYEQARAAMAAVERRFHEGGPADMSKAAGWTIPAPTFRVRSVSVGATGAVTIQYADGIAQPEESLLQFVPVAGGAAVDLSRTENAGRKFQWQCGGPAGKSTATAKLRPDPCR